MGFSVTHSDGSVTRHSSYESAMSAANASAARSGGAVQDTTSRASSGGGSSGSNGSSANNVDRPLGGGGGTGGYRSFRDMFDGGGPGQSGSTFGGLLGGVSNALGFSPVASDTDRGSGSVYQGPNLDGSSGYIQDPGLMGVDTSTGFITSDANKFSPAPPVFDAVAYLGGGDDGPGSVSLPPLTPEDPLSSQPPVGGEEDSAGAYSPFLAGTASYAPVASVSVVPGNDLLYEDYLARLMARNQLLQPLGVTPLGGMPSGGVSPLNQGIGSLA